MKISEERVLTDMEKCTIKTRGGKRTTISCKLGLWSVSGSCESDVIGEANHYFEQYKTDGEYSEIIGGKTVLETLAETRR